MSTSWDSRSDAEVQAALLGLRLTEGERQTLAIQARYEAGKQKDPRYWLEDAELRALWLARWREIADALHPDPWGQATAIPAEDAWHCPRCGSPQWVAASLTGPISHGGKAIRQCVPCGQYSNDPV